MYIPRHQELTPRYLPITDCKKDSVPRTEADIEGSPRSSSRSRNNNHDPDDSTNTTRQQLVRR